MAGQCVRLLVKFERNGRGGQSLRILERFLVKQSRRGGRKTQGEWMCHSIQLHDEKDRSRGIEHRGERTLTCNAASACVSG